MEQSKVYLSDLRASNKENLLSKLNRLMDSAGFMQTLAPRDLVAIKLHFGEKGNTAYIRPVFIRKIVDHILELDGVPFITDANTLYGGTRGNSASHIRTAIENGFAYSVVNAPIVIADGIRGASSSDIHIGQEMIETAYIGKEIAEADAIVSVAHFKGHELSGFGGTIKNVGMGCASRKGKLEQHSDLSPKVKAKRCLGCGTCVDHCAQKAIALKKEKAFIDPEKCVGCSDCILVCPEEAIEIQWDTDVEKFQKKMAEYALAVLGGKEKKRFFLNFLTDISPACDCYGHCDAPIVHDIGILAATDPVAIDQAAADLVNLQNATEGSCLSECKAPGEDKFKGLYPKIDWSVQLAHGEKIGLGTRRYELVRI